MRDLEPATCCTQFLSKENEIVKDMQDASRTYNARVVNSADAERGSRHVWFFNSMAIEKILTHKTEILELITNVENSTFLDASFKTSLGGGRGVEAF